MRKVVSFAFCIILSASLFCQVKWINVDSMYQPLPPSVHIYFTDQPIDTAVFRAYYLIADLKDRSLDFTVDTTLNRRLTPSKFYEKNDHPLVIVNCTFFSFETNRNLNLVIKDGKLVGYNVHTVALKGKDTLTYLHPFRSAIGISQRRKADIGWTYTDSLFTFPFILQKAKHPAKDSVEGLSLDSARYYASPIGQINISPSKVKLERDEKFIPQLEKWKIQTAIGGGPVLLQQGEVKITNNEEIMFAGRAINDKHPRTAMGYTKGNKLIILVVEGRNNIAHGATLQQEAEILKNLGCIEALNLDGGGSSCMLINGKETIKPSDKEGQRPVPAIFIIRRK
jgi:Phosphodiester glycosidase